MINLVPSNRKKTSPFALAAIVFTASFFGLTFVGDSLSSGRALAESTKTQSAQSQSQGAFAEAPKDAGEFLVALGERAVEELSDNGIADTERERRFRVMFNESFDVRAIGRFVLGINWRRASEQQRQDFLKVFEDSAVQRFLPLFADYTGESFTIHAQRRDANNPEHIFVTSQIARDSGEPVNVVWRVRERGADFQILDISAEGVSMAITLRQEYASVVKQEGVDGLVKALRAKVNAGGFALRGTASQ